MRSLYLLRHAKSAWNTPGIADIQRPLSSRGEAAGKLLQQHFANNDIHPDRVLCSPALRTRQTLAFLLSELPASGQIQFEPSIYHSDASTVTRLISDQSDAHQSVLLIGHNPTIQAMVLWLAGSGESAMLESVRTKLPTGALITLRAPLERWSALTQNCFEMTGFARPRDMN